MRNSTKIFTSIIIIIQVLLSCTESPLINLQGNWRECVNDSFVIDYTIKKDTIKVKFCHQSWCYIVAYIQKDSSYLCKDSTDCYYFEKIGDTYYKDPLIFKFLSWSDSTAIITRDQQKNIKLIKLKEFQNKLPLKIKFDMVTKFSNNKINKDVGIGEGDYELTIDGNYKIFLIDKLYTGKISDTLLNEFKTNYALIDTSDKRSIKHYFEIHQIEQDYEVTLYFENKTEYFDITDRQPYQFSRLSYTLEKIWYEMLQKSGHRIK